MVTPEKKNIASTEKIKSTRTNNTNTLKSAETDRVIVAINACSPLFFLASRTILVTLRTLRILIIWGNDDNAPDVLGIKVIIISSKLVDTIKQSNLFQAVSKYLNENARILRYISIVKIAVKK